MVQARFVWTSVENHQMLIKVVVRVVFIQFNIFVGKNFFAPYIPIVEVLLTLKVVALKSLMVIALEVEPTLK